MVGDNPEENFQELLDNLAIALNQPFGLNMNISYETLMASSLKRILQLVKKVKEFNKTLEEQNV